MIYNHGMIDAATVRDHVLYQRLAQAVAPRGRLLTAFSGGVDSTLVAAAARRELGKENAPAAIGDSASLPRHEFAEAIDLAKALDLEVIVVKPDEQADPDYQANRGDRCYFCKTHLYTTLRPVAAARGITWIANGTNKDDLGDHRPGLAAASEAGVVSPLVDAGLSKADVRELAKLMQLPNWDKPAAACLASRLAYGTPVTLERLSRVEQAENALRELGFKGFRVRHHDTVARIELPLDQVPRMLEGETRERVTAALKQAGYLYVTLDLEGFRSGSGNALLTVGLSGVSRRQEAP